MGLVKILKSRPWMSRYQTKYRRRREGKTDYHARRRLVGQDKGKYNNKKYRLVVRRTNTKILAQIIYATMAGDRVVCSADSTELPHFGVKVGLTNYSAAYCVGLLVARRMLKSVKLDSTYKGVSEASGEDYHVEEEMGDGARPFKAILDVGLTRTTTGNRVFGVLKGAIDGGLHVPHSNRRMPGFAAEEDGKGGAYDAEAHKKRILGQHVADYMKSLKSDDPDRYQKVFSQFDKNGVKPEGLTLMYTKAHAAIRSNPDRVKKERKQEPMHVREGDYIKTSKSSYVRAKPLSNDQKKERVQQKIDLAREKATAKANAAAEDDE